MSYFPTGQYEQDLGYLEMDGIWDTVKKIGKAGFEAVSAHGAQKGQAEAYKQMALAQQQAAMAKQGGMPKWLLPVGIGAGALVLILILTKKKS